MGTEEKDEILSNLSALATLIKWLGGGAVSAFLALIGLVVADHYDQENIRRDTNWMKPRVERMWYKTHPEDLEATKNLIP